VRLRAIGIPLIGRRAADWGRADHHTSFLVRLGSGERDCTPRVGDIEDLEHQVDLLALVVERDHLRQVERPPRHARTEAAAVQRSCAGRSADRRVADVGSRWVRTAQHYGS